MKQTSYKCPECGSTASFEVDTMQPVILTIDTTGDVIDQDIVGREDFFGTDNMECSDCGHEAPAHHFTVETIVIIGLPVVRDTDLDHTCVLCNRTIPATEQNWFFVDNLYNWYCGHHIEAGIAVNKEITNGM